MYPNMTIVLSFLGVLSDLEALEHDTDRLEQNMLALDNASPRNDRTCSNA